MQLRPCPEIFISRKEQVGGQLGINLVTITTLIWWLKLHTDSREISLTKCLQWHPGKSSMGDFIFKRSEGKLIKLSESKKWKDRWTGKTPESLLPQFYLLCVLSRYGIGWARSVGFGVKRFSVNVSIHNRNARTQTQLGRVMTRLQMSGSRHVGLRAPNFQDCSQWYRGHRFWLLFIKVKNDSIKP